METQKIVNLLNDFDNDRQNLQQRNGMSFMIKMVQTMEKEIKMVQALNLRQKISNQVFAITQMQIFL